MEHVSACGIFFPASTATSAALLVARRHFSFPLFSYQRCVYSTVLFLSFTLIKLTNWFTAIDDIHGWCWWTVLWLPFTAPNVSSPLGFSTFLLFLLGRAGLLHRVTDRQSGQWPLSLREISVCCVGTQRHNPIAVFSQVEVPCRPSRFKRTSANVMPRWDRVRGITYFGIANCQLTALFRWSTQFLAPLGRVFAFVVVMMFLEQAEDGFPLLSLFCGSVAIVCLSVY